MPEAIKAACDICGQIYRLGEERLGRSTSCKVCGTKFTVEEFVPPKEEEEEEHDSPWPWIKGGFTLMLMLAILFSRLGKRPSPRKVRTLIEQMMGIHKRMQTIHDELFDERYPFDHSDDSMTLQKFVLPVVPHPADLQGLVIMTEYMVERLFTLQIRLFSRLTQAAERVESTFGLEPLPDVKEKSAVQ